MQFAGLNLLEVSTSRVKQSTCKTDLMGSVVHIPSFALGWTEHKWHAGPGSRTHGQGDGRMGVRLEEKGRRGLGKLQLQWCSVLFLDNSL